MRTVTTRLTRCFDLQTPILCAPMAGATGGLLAGRVSAAGGLGLIGTNAVSPSSTRTQVELARKELAHVSGRRLPIGVGFMGWRLEGVDRREAERAVADVAEDVSCIWISFGTECKHWVSLVNSFGKGKDPKPCKSILLVGSVDEAVDTLSWPSPPDVLVLQSIEAGGHGSNRSPPLLSFVTAVTGAFQRAGVGPDDPRRPILLGAGGIATGAHVAAVLALGADGAVCGTRFLATPESLYSPAQKELIVRSRGEDTVRTMVYDRVRDTMGWPATVDGRAISNLTFTDSEAGRSDDEVKRSYDEAAKSGSVDRIVTWSGTSVSDVTEVKPAADVVAELTAETAETVDRLAAFVR